MQHIEHVIISCAGLGSRLGLNVPKCLVEVNNKKLIDYQLDLLGDVRDVRIIVGFKELEVMNHVRKIRPDATFVRNPAYATTSNSYSIYLAVKDLKKPFVVIDGDLIISPADFSDFMLQAEQSNQTVIGITPAKTTEAVFVALDSQQHIIEFTRTPGYSHEWCGIAYLQDITIDPQSGYLFNHFLDKLPLKSFEIACYEIDTPEDLDLASSKSHQLFTDNAGKKLSA